MFYGWGTWEASWLWSILLISITVAIHATGIVAIARTLARFENQSTSERDPNDFAEFGAIGSIVSVSLALALLLGVESGVWAIAYVRLDALTSPSDAVLYSFDSMTTRGASGLLLAEPWRLMGALESADGLLLFGISTSFLFSVMSRLLGARVREAER